jgi:hypothetical protein
VSARLGVSYDDLLRSVHGSIPQETYREIVNDVTRIKLGCDLLIVFFEWSTGEPFIFRINDDGAIELCFNFAAIGSGLYIAESSLFYREHSENVQLPDAIYHVYEAMRLGSHAPSVGKKFAMGISYAGESGQTQWQYVESDYMAFLEQDFKKLGPQPMRPQVLRKDLLRTLTFDRQKRKLKRK